ncbi:MAG: transporter substrate-binding domain-containing protein [Lachnospiraceae bacterium]|nr:transporter substrate-binding domain-containing protein [Lachnospiraceae bacterium]
MKKKLALMLTLALTVGTVLTGCGNASGDAAQTTADNAQTADGSDVAYIQDKGTLIVGITDFAPMDYKNESGEWIGFDADMARIVAKKLGVEAQFVEIDWDNKIMELDSKNIDVVWNGMTLTSETTSSMECTRPYCNNAQVIVIPDTADAAGAEFVYAVEAGSAGEAAAKDKGFQVNVVASQADALMEVASGTSDAAIIDLLMAGAMIGEGTSYPNMKYTDELTTEEYGVGCRKGSDLAAYINSVFAESYADGSMKDTATTYGVQEALVEQTNAE